MSLSPKFSSWKFEKTRLEAFSDGVFAIIITLLVLELKIPPLPPMADSAGLWDALKEIMPVLLSWVVSFLIVGTFWLNHHNIFMMARKADYAVVWMNTLFLLFATLIPFPTRLMGDNPHIPLAVASLGIVMFFSTLVAISMYRYIALHLLREEYDRKTVLKNVRRAYLIGPLFYLMAIGSAWISTTLTFVFYAVIPLLFMLPLDKPTKTELD